MKSIGLGYLCGCVGISVFTDDSGVFETTIVVYSTNTPSLCTIDARSPGGGVANLFLRLYFNQAIRLIFHPDPSRKIPAGSEELH